MIKDTIIFEWENDKTCKGFRPVPGYLIYDPEWKMEVGKDGTSEIIASITDDKLFDLGDWIKALMTFKETGTTSIRSDNTEVKNGDFGVGNAHLTLVWQDKLYSQCEFVDDLKVLLTIDQYVYILKQFQKIYDTGQYKNPDIVPEPIEIEYIAEGKEALRLWREYELQGAAEGYEIEYDDIEEE